MQLCGLNIFWNIWFYDFFFLSLCAINKFAPCLGFKMKLDPTTKEGCLLACSLACFVTMISQIPPTHFVFWHLWKSIKEEEWTKFISSCRPPMQTRYELRKLEVCSSNSLNLPFVGTDAGFIIFKPFWSKSFFLKKINHQNFPQKNSQKNSTIFLQKLDFIKMQILCKNKLQHVLNSLNNSTRYHRALGF
jgi:hypothetical protein